MSDNYSYSWYLDDPVIIWGKPDKYKNISTSQMKKVVENKK